MGVWAQSGLGGGAGANGPCQWGWRTVRSAGVSSHFPPPRACPRDTSQAAGVQLQGGVQLQLGVLQPLQQPPPSSMGSERRADQPGSQDVSEQPNDFGWQKSAASACLLYHQCTRHQLRGPASSSFLSPGHHSDVAL